MSFPALTPGTGQVWWAEAGSAGPGLAGLLDSHERDRWEAMQAGAGTYLAAHALARLVLGGLAGLPASGVRFERRCLRCGGPHGKPRPVRPEPVPVT